jgi:hypothetical protein
MKLTFRDIIWVAIITLVIIVLSKCHRDDQGRLSESVKTLHDKHTKDSITASKLIIQQELENAELVKRADSAQKINDSLGFRLDANAATVIKLSKALQKAKQPGIDTNFITVDKDYVTYCDSMAYTASNLAVDFTKYKNNNAYVLATKDETIKGKDQIIATERIAKQGCMNDYNTLMKHYQEYQRANKPTNQIFIGAELIGTPTYLVNNAGLALTLKTKSNKLWQISAGLQTNGQYYARFNGNILIKLKR